MEKIRTLVVDDEPLARERIIDLLKADTDIEIVGECPDGGKAVTAIQELAPQLLFLDIQMPVMNGFKVLAAIEGVPMPAVVFVTAYDQYALRAFEVHALDYLLKPFSRKRFARALQHAKSEIMRGQSEEVNRKLLSMLESLSPPSRYLERLVVKSAGRIFFVRVEQIDWIDTVGNYARLHIGRDTHLIRDTLNNLEAKLDPNRFLRIHRSSIVNIDSVKELQLMPNNDYLVLLHDGTQLPLSRGGLELFKKN